MSDNYKGIDYGMGQTNIDKKTGNVKDLGVFCRDIKEGVKIEKKLESNFGCEYKKLITCMEIRDTRAVEKFSKFLKFLKIGILTPQNVQSDVWKKASDFYVKVKSLSDNFSFKDCEDLRRLEIDHIEYKCVTLPDNLEVLKVKFLMAFSSDQKIFTIKGKSLECLEIEHFKSGKLKFEYEQAEKFPENLRVLKINRLEKDSSIDLKNCKTLKEVWIKKEDEAKFSLPEGVNVCYYH